MLSKLDCSFFCFLLFIMQYIDNQLITCGYLPMQNLWYLSKIGCNSLLHIGLFIANEHHFGGWVTDG